MQLPLGYTIVDLEDILAPAEYLLDIVDHKGEALGLTIDITIGQPLRNGADEPSEPPAVATILPTFGSDTRLVLEANVRATQLAFQHNQKTLELGLRMAETLRDGVRVLAESQSDWIKSIASAKGFLRNVAPPPLLPAPTPPPEPDEPEEEVEEDEPHWVDKLMPHVVPIVQMVVPMLTARRNKSPDAPKTGFQFGDLFNWQRAADRAKVADPEPAPTEEAIELPPIDMQAAAHFVQIQQALTPEEATLARMTAKQLSPIELHAWFAELKELSVPDAVAKIRTLLSKPAA
jgi:hypothetical protein